MPDETSVKTGKKITAHEYQCRNCGELVWGKIKEGKQVLPVHCPSCNNQYWNKPYTRPDYVKKQ